MRIDIVKLSYGSFKPTTSFTSYKIVYYSFKEKRCPRECQRNQPLQHPWKKEAFLQGLNNLT